MAFSQTLGKTIFFALDEQTKAALVEAGADKCSIYTKDELRFLLAHHREKRFIPEELCKLHELKSMFRGKIVS